MFTILGTVVMGILSVAAVVVTYGIVLVGQVWTLAVVPAYNYIQTLI